MHLLLGWWKCTSQHAEVLGYLLMSRRDSKNGQHSAYGLYAQSITFLNAVGSTNNTIMAEDSRGLGREAFLAAWEGLLGLPHSSRGSLYLSHLRRNRIRTNSINSAAIVLQ